MPSLRDLVENGDLAGVQRAVQDDPALLDAPVTANKHTPLMWALYEGSGGQPAIAQWLIERGAKLDLQRNGGWTALMEACRYEQPDTAQLLIERGAKLDLQSNGEWTALMFACRYEQPDTVQLLIERGAKLDLQNNNGWTALMLACQQPSQSSHHAASGLLRCIKLCYAASADLELKTKKGCDALALAKECKRADAVAFLEFATMLEVARGVQGSLQQPRSVVAASLLSQDNGDTEPEAILDRAQDLYEKSQTPLMQACRKGDLARAKKLVSDGAQVDARDKLSLTPMIYACKFNKEDDSLTLAKLLFEGSAGLSSKSLGIDDALAHASSKDRMELSAFLSFTLSIPLEHFHSNALRVMAVKLFDQGVRTLEEARRLTPARLEQLGIPSAPDCRELFEAFAHPEPIASIEVLAAKVTLARTKRKEGKPILHPRLAEILAEQLSLKDPVASLANFDRQQTILREKEKELIALQEAVKANSEKVHERDTIRRDLVAGIQDALSGGIEGQLRRKLANPGTKAVVDTCHSLWKDILKESADVDGVVTPVSFGEVQKATQAAMDALKAWEARHDTSAMRQETEAAITALDESTGRFDIQSVLQVVVVMVLMVLVVVGDFWLLSLSLLLLLLVMMMIMMQSNKMRRPPYVVAAPIVGSFMSCSRLFTTLKHSARTRNLTVKLRNVQLAFEEELSALTDADIMADAPLEEVRRALASTISFYTCCTVKDDVSRLQTAVEDLSSSLSKHVPGLVPPDTSRMAEMIQNISQSKRRREDLELKLERTREDANDGDAKARDRIHGLEQELAQLGSLYKLDSELRKERARVLRHAEEHYPELLRDDKWMKSLGVKASVPRELSTLGLWLTNAKRSDFETLSELASKPGKSVLKVRDLNGQDFVLKSFHLANDQWSSRFYRQVAALAQIKSAYIVRIQGVFMQDAHQGCTLMPFYSGGDLSTWIRENPHADLATRRRIAIGLLSGLHDLHSQGYVHCDVKPENIFLAPGLSPVLGDFDGVQMHNVTMTQPMQATYRFMAPELRNGNVDRVESAVDLFSAGMVLADLFENKEVSDATTSLISFLRSTEPTQRPTALQALRHEAFQVEPVKQASCAICLDIYPVKEGVSCADDHFTCKECLSGSVRAATQPKAHVNVLRDGSMCCVTPDCELLISGRTIASVVPEDFGALLDIVRAHFERDAAAEQKRQLRDRIDAALREHGLDPTTQNHIRTIQNEILTMSCPRCSAAFVDYDGCCALECGACPCRFCAWCLQDTGNDSRACHQHVASCASKPAGEDRFFGQKHVVRQVWCQLRAQRLCDYMARRVQDAGIRASVQNNLRPLLTPDIVGDNFSF